MDLSVEERPQGEAVRRKRGGLNIEKRAGLVDIVIEEGLENISPSPFRGLLLANDCMSISLVLMYESVKERWC